MIHFLASRWFMTRYRCVILTCFVVIVFPLYVDSYTQPAELNHSVRHSKGKKTRPVSERRKHADPMLEWKECGDACINTIFDDETTSIHIPPIKGILRDIAIQGENLYLLVRNFNLITDAIFVMSRDTGTIRAIWGIGRLSAEAIASDSRSIWILSGSKKYFLRRLSPQGVGVEDVSVRSLPEGEVNGLAFARGTFVFTVRSKQGTDIYALNPGTGTLARLFSCSGIIPAITFFRGSLIALQQDFDTYASRWLLTINLKTGLKNKMNFIDAEPLGFAATKKRIYMMERCGRGACVYPVIVLPSKGLILANPVVRRLEITFPLIRRSPDPFDADLWIPYPMNRRFQNVRRIEIEPDPRETVTDKYGNRWAHVSWHRARGDVRAVLRFDMLTCAAAYTLNRGYRAVSEDIPGEIRRDFLQETLHFDTSNYVVKSHSTRIQADGPYVERILAVRSYVDKAVYCFGNEPRWSKASDCLFKGRGDAYSKTLGFVALSRFLGIPARAAGGILVDRSAHEPGEEGAVWDQVYFPGAGWIDIYSGVGPVPGSFACRSNRFFITFEGDFDKVDYAGVFTGTDWRVAYKWSNAGARNGADVLLGRVLIDAHDLSE
jgi:transglutaminase-like putative cysteine protease